MVIRVYDIGRAVVRKSTTTTGVSVATKRIAAEKVVSEVGATVKVVARPSVSTSGACKVVVDSRMAAVRSEQTLALVGVEEADLVAHGLGTGKIDVVFYDVNGRRVVNMDFEPVGTTHFKVYLPFSDTPVDDSFTGEAWVRARG